MLSHLPTLSEIRKFRSVVWDYYRTRGRSLPWRRNIDPYAIVVSEIMLQQTQVGRVVPKFESFMAMFPNFKSLASASPAAVIAAWQGLGYNRRALFLHKLAKLVVRDYAGTVPRSMEDLEKLPGVGHATARSIAAFAFNSPVVFIETNIRRTFIHHFFPNAQNVSDRDLLPVITATLPRHRSREWYWALMDYGTHLATQVANPNQRSRHYTKQSRFEGSRRQVRGAILRVLTTGPAKLVDVARHLNRPVGEVGIIVDQLVTEGFIVRAGQNFRLKS